MANVVAVKEETNLAGVLKSQLTATGLSFTALFYDTKTGAQRTPQSTTLTFTLNKDGAKAERVRLTSHTTDATTGITTCTIASSGRALPKYGVGSGSSTGFQHEPGDPIGCVTSHEPTAQLINWMEGVVGSGANNLRIGDGVAGNKTIYAENADASKPFLRYDDTANTWVFSNDGVSSTAIGSGASVYTGGDGISVTASDIDIDLTDTVIFVSTSAGAGDSGKVPRLNGSGKLDTSFITPAPYLTYISDHPAIVGGSTSNADADHTHSGLSTAVVAIEAIDGSVTAKPVSILGNNHKGIKIAPASGRTFFSTLTGTSLQVGDVDARAKRGQSFTITDTLAVSLTVESITVMMEVTGTPGDYVTLEISADSGGYPSTTIITNGTATPIIGSSLNTDARPVKFTFPTPPTITSGTKYHWAVRRSTVDGAASALDAANYYRLFDANADTLGSETSSVYTASTLTWSGSTSTDLQFLLQYNADYDGKAAISDGNTFPRTRLKGFTTSNVSAGETLAMNTSVVAGLSLTAGADYYLSGTQGDLTTTLPSFSTSFNGLVPIVKAGYAINSTTLKIEPSYEALLILSDIYSSGQPLTQGTTDATLDVFIETGFRPREFDVRFIVDNLAGSATADTYVVSKFIYTTQLNTFTITSPSLTLSGVTSTIAASNSTYLTIQEVHENGFVLRIFSTEATAEALRDVSIFIKS